MRDVLWGLDSTQLETWKIRIFGNLTIGNIPPPPERPQTVLKAIQRVEEPIFSPKFPHDNSTMSYNNKPIAPAIPQI